MRTDFIGRDRILLITLREQAGGDVPLRRGSHEGHSKRTASGIDSTLLQLRDPYAGQISLRPNARRRPARTRTLFLAENTGEEFASLFEFFVRYVTQPDSLGLVKAG
jgi:hypothetical protein